MDPGQDRGMTQENLQIVHVVRNMAGARTVVNTAGLSPHSSFDKQREQLSHAHANTTHG